MIIKLKSTPENFEKEKSGIKPNTVRKLDGGDRIEITNSKTGERIIRKIEDITTFDGRIIFSFQKR